MEAEAAPAPLSLLQPYRCSRPERKVEMGVSAAALPPPTPRLLEREAAGVLALDEPLDAVGDDASLLCGSGRSSRKPFI